ncbi:uncharacterized protein LOC142356175, partial [Convolutriloba macropyga]|uniref:uncharacterized protein LOC142356175 n=1 Tax=Convolutriloba macropyga TaxID=536237 RepID=UPI003F521056
MAEFDDCQPQHLSLHTAVLQPRRAVSGQTQSLDCLVASPAAWAWRTLKRSLWSAPDCRRVRCSSCTTLQDSSFFLPCQHATAVSGQTQTPGRPTKSCTGMKAVHTWHCSLPTDCFQACGHPCAALAEDVSNRERGSGSSRASSSLHFLSGWPEDSTPLRSLHTAIQWRSSAMLSQARPRYSEREDLGGATSLEHATVPRQIPPQDPTYGFCVS